MTIVSHIRPGGGLPDWATKTAVKALAPIEPFKLFHKIDRQVAENRDRLEALVNDNDAEKGSGLPPGRTSRPGGFAQIGYACFWPNGGGKVDSGTPAGEDPSENSGDDDGSPGGPSQDDGDEAK